jgi:hypothetical protein
MTRGWKSVCLLPVFALSAPLSFGGELVSFAAGLGSFTEKFPDDHYTRRGRKSSFDTTWLHYPENFPLGLFAGIGYGNPHEGKFYEENQWESMKTREHKAHDIRLFFGPSYKWNITEDLSIPLSLGPLVSFYFEETEEHLLSDKYLQHTEYRYTALSGGVKGGLALLCTPGQWFFIKGGFTAEWLFLRGEALQMRMNYRTTNNAVLTWAPYSGLYTAFYVAAGIRIDS